jgi:hypothetical protein
LTTELELFLKYLHETSAQDWPSELHLQYQQLNIPNTGNLTGAAVGDKLFENIRNALQVDPTAKDNIGEVFLNQLMAELCYIEVLEGTTSEWYIGVVKAIKYALKHEVLFLPPIMDSAKWSNAIAIATQSVRQSPAIYKYVYGELRKEMPREYDVACAVKTLVGYRCKYECIGGKLRITHGLEQVVNELEKMIDRFGCAEWIEFLFHDLEAKGFFSQRYERFHIYRTANWQLDDQNAQVPYGYLFHLTIKNLHVKRPKHLSQPAPEAILNLAKTIVQGSYDVQPYFGMEYMVKKGMYFLDMCQEAVIWDSILAIPQARPFTALELNRGLLECVSDTDFMLAMGVTRDLFFQVCKEIYNTNPDKKTAVEIYASKITAQIGKEFKSQILSVLQLLSHQAGFNHSYYLPIDVEQNSYPFKPLIQVGETKFILPSRSAGAPAFFEAMAAALRKTVNQFDNKIGLEIEKYLMKRLKLKGLAVYSGKYNAGKIEGECDLLVETNNGIVLIECKKKSLTRKSKAGTQLNLALDLADSLISASIQNCRTELILREQGRLALTDWQGNTHLVQLRGREICSISLTLLDYGSLHDPTIMRKILEALVDYSVSAKDADSNITTRFEELEKKRAVWRKQYQKLLALDADFERFPYLNTLFMNLVQFIEVLDECEDAKSFYAMLAPNKFTTHGTLDWYRERESYHLAKTGTIYGGN